MALVLVLVVVALLMGLVLAMLFMSSSESRSSAAYSATQEVRGLGEMPATIVMGQIREATSGLGLTKTWASQPGMIRVFGTAAGAKPGRSRVEKVWRLYSSDKMVEPGQGFDALNEAASIANWNEHPARFTDLNEPVAQIGKDGQTRLIFPVVDAGALAPSSEGSEPMAGFGIAPASGAPGVTAKHPLPMPVRWLYVLRDGKLLTPTGGEGGKALFDADKITPQNPIVGRIAFWTDDESCKINVNTAGEGTGWDVPRGTGWSDRSFAYFPPAQNEFQRFPGHPAMTSLSTVLQYCDPKYKYLNPVIQSDGTVKDPAVYRSWLRGIYSLTPRLHLGGQGEGSQGGTQVPGSGIGLPLKRERLFSSVDEFFYGTGFDDTARHRKLNLSEGAVDAADLQKCQFFLTAQSRAPEVNLYNRPRVSLWPVQKETSKQTAKDKLLAFCATSAGEEGTFRRVSTWENATTKQGSSQSPTADFQLEENKKLFGYLQELTKKQAPGFGGDSFDGKYGSLNRNQILLNVFDMIRWGVNSSNPGGNPASYYLPPRSYTQLNPTNLAQGSAVPVVASGTPTEDFGAKLKAFGRFPTIIEASLVFMATNVETIADPANPASTIIKDTAPADQKSDNTKKMRAFLVLQPYTPIVGMPSYSANVRYRIKGMENWKVDNVSLGMPDAAVNRVWVPGGNTRDSGDATAYTGLNAQFYKSTSAVKTVVYGGASADQTNSFPFASLEVDVTGKTGFKFSGGPITIETHLGDGPASPLDDSTLIQTATMDFPESSSTWPVPRVQVGTAEMEANTSWDEAKSFMNLQARLNKKNVPKFLIVLGDTVRSVVAGADGPGKGDYRMLCGLQQIPATFYQPHHEYQSATTAEAQSLVDAASRFTGHFGRTHDAENLNGKDARQHVWQMAGYEFEGNKVSKSYGLLRDVRYWQDCQPAGPWHLNGAYHSDNRPGDWDTGVGRTEDGAYINKPDDFNITLDQTKERTSYFERSGSTDEASGRLYSPNRQICSAVAFGSLPSALHADSDSGRGPTPWQTLLFCPNPPSRSTAAGGTPTEDDHWGFRTPKDHLLLDLFWMPVVEPYAISEPLSTAGKINLNTQIMPFTYIRRETGLHAALRSVRLNALPAEVAWAKDAPSSGANKPRKEECYKGWDTWLKYETVYEVNAEETMKGIRQRFEEGDIFRSASEICEIFLVPKPMAGRTYYPRTGGLPSSSPTYDSMVTWWNGDLNTQMDGFELTGDNVRESPYNQLYPRLTTKSNVFTVHYRVQLLKKARSTAAAEWDEARDSLSAEKRGSVVIERYIDPNASGLPEFFKKPLQEGSLDEHYQFRIMHRKTFAP